MNRPTKRQVREFWEWCGFDYSKYPPIIAPSGAIWWEEDIKLDLNNLFKYAVPKVDSVFKYDLDRGRHTWLITLVMNPDKLIVGEDEDPALALFWALWKVKVS